MSLLIIDVSNDRARFSKYIVCFIRLNSRSYSFRMSSLFFLCCCSCQFECEWPLKGWHVHTINPIYFYTIGFCEYVCVCREFMDMETELGHTEKRSTKKMKHTNTHIENAHIISVKHPLIFRCFSLPLSVLFSPSLARSLYFIRLLLFVMIMFFFSFSWFFRWIHVHSTHTYLHALWAQPLKLIIIPSKLRLIAFGARQENGQRRREKCGTKGRKEEEGVWTDTTINI